MRVLWRSPGLASLPLIAALLVAACGSSSNTGNANSTGAAGTSAVRTSAATSPAAVATAVAPPTLTTATSVGGNRAPSPVANSSAAPTSGSGSSAASGTILTEIATDNKFSQTNYTIKAGQEYLLNFQNSGQAIHNWDVTGTKGADGKQITVPLTDPGKTSTVTFRIDKPGTYHFQCDVHPDEMKGTITVQP
jgi:plastocyanin